MSETDLAIPDHERIGSKREPGFRLPKDIGYFAYNFLAIEFEGVKKSLGKTVEQRGKELTDFGRSTVGSILGDEDGLIRKVLHNGINTYSGGLKMVLEYDFSGY